MDIRIESNLNDMLLGLSFMECENELGEYEGKVLSIVFIVF